MAAIRAAGGTGMLKSASTRHIEPTPPPQEAHEDDLAAAIRAALDARKGALASSGTYPLQLI
jgi:hypothetical protein